MNRAAFAALAAAALTSCATEANYQANVKSFMGLPELALIRAWGPPSSSYETGGSRFLTYQWRGNSYVVATGSPIVPAAIVGKWCDTTFEYRAGVAVSWRYQGNGCKSKD